LRFDEFSFDPGSSNTLEELPFNLDKVNTFGISFHSNTLKNFTVYIDELRVVLPLKVSEEELKKVVGELDVKSKNEWANLYYKIANQSYEIGEYETAKSDLLRAKLICGQLNNTCDVVDKVEILLKNIEEKVKTEGKNIEEKVKTEGKKHIIFELIIALVAAVIFAKVCEIRKIQYFIIAFAALFVSFYILRHYLWNYF
jgi:hypothetical protein